MKVRHEREQRKAVCLVSGGMDSAVALATARTAGFECYALTFDYGQRHRHELAAAARVSKALEAREQRIVAIDLRAIGGSALTDSIDVPKDRTLETIGADVPPTYVPARNTIFLAVALSWAEVIGARDIFIGANAVDSSGYPDCRASFLAAFGKLARVATVAGAEEGAHFQVRAPLLKMTKADIVRRAHDLGVDLALTHSCYDPVVSEAVVLACGRCDACQLRLNGFEEAGLRDPLAYAT